MLTTRYPDPAGDAALEVVVTDSAALVSSLTCRDIGVGTGEDVPAALVPLAQRAVALKAEVLALGGTAEARAAAGASGRLASFNAGPYGESYFSPDIAARAGVLDPDPALHEVLWALATEDCRAAWLLLWASLRGENVPPPPAYAVEEIDWSPGLTYPHWWW